MRRIGLDQHFGYYDDQSTTASGTQKAKLGLLNYVVFGENNKNTT
jgi:hypothetical protein